MSDTHQNGYFRAGMKLPGKCDYFLSFSSNSKVLDDSCRLDKA